MSERSKWEERVVSDEEALEMAPVLDDLVRSPGWKLYVELLQGARSRTRAAGFEESKDQFDFFKGLVAGLTVASDLPGDVLAQARRSVREAEKAPAGRRFNLVREQGDTVV